MSTHVTADMTSGVVDCYGRVLVRKGHRGERVAEVQIVASGVGSVTLAMTYSEWAWVRKCLGDLLDSAKFDRDRQRVAEKEQDEADNRRAIAILDSFCHDPEDIGPGGNHPAADTCLPSEPEQPRRTANEP